jgi:hypothetical protein
VNKEKEFVLVEVLVVVWSTLNVTGITTAAASNNNRRRANIKMQGDVERDHHGFWRFLAVSVSSPIVCICCRSSILFCEDSKFIDGCIAAGEEFELIIDCVELP